jgi:hypothetical protein
MIVGMMTPGRSRNPAKPNHRQQLALERIEFAVSELTTVLLSSCQSRARACEAIQSIRRAVAPVLAAILEAE